MKTILSLLILMSVAAPSNAQTAASLTRIGGAGAVRGTVNAMAPNATVGRVVESGKPLYLNDHVTTKADSRLQVLLLDESVFTVGPDSDMVLDEFVYDPNTSAGKVTANLTKGVFRFVTGKVARQGSDGMKIKVPTGTIGIRGTEGVLEVRPEQTTAILVAEGANNTANLPASMLNLATKDGSTSLTRVGFGSDMRASGPPTPPVDRSADLARLNNSLNPKPTSNAAPAEQTKSDKKNDPVQETGGDALASLGGVQSTSDVNQQSNENTQTTQQATQDNPVNKGGGDGLTTWDFIRSSRIVGDGFFFSGHAPISCSGACINNSSPNNPQGAVQLYINFGAKTIGGSTSFAGPSGFSGSFIHIHNINSIGDTIEQTIGANSGSNPISYSSLSGAAALTLSSSNLGSLTGNGTGTGNFNGSTISLQNSGGVTASNAAVNLTFSGTNNATAAIGASGTFIAPLQ